MLGDSIKEKYAIPPGEIVRGCDLYPQDCKYKEVPCDRIDANGTLPYGENAFDAACRIEVIEHIFYCLADTLSRAGFRQVTVHFDRYKRSAMAWSLLLYLPLRIAHTLYEWKLARKNKVACLENANFLKHINRFGMIASRTLIIEGLK